MEEHPSPFRRYVLFCDFVRDEGECCASAGGALRDELKKRVKTLGLKPYIRVSRTGCLGICKQGPHALLMPDNVWFKAVTPEDLDTILEHAMKGIPETPTS